MSHRLIHLVLIQILQYVFCVVAAGLAVLHTAGYLVGVATCRRMQQNSMVYALPFSFSLITNRTIQ